MLHCHVDGHLDAGMSARYQVLARGRRKMEEILDRI